MNVRHQTEEFADRRDVAASMAAALLPEDEALGRYASTRDPRLLARLVRRWMPLARHLAARYAATGEPLEDLVQVAALGLVKALKRYDAARATSFTAYASPTIVGELKRHLRDTTWAVHVPRGMQERVLLVSAVRAELERDLRRSPSAAEVAAASGLRPEDVLEAERAAEAHLTTSLEAAPRAGDGLDAADVVGADDEALTSIEERMAWTSLMRCVDRRDRQILRLRFEDDLMQRQIGEAVGLSQAQICRRLRDAMDVLRAASVDAGLTDRAAA